jgi:hypothetical protein
MRSVTLLCAALTAGLVLVASRAAFAAEPAQSDAKTDAAPPSADVGGSFMAGATVTYFSPVLGAPFTDAPALGAGPAFKVSAGWRWGAWYLGGAYQHAFLGGGTWSHESSIENTSSASSDYAGLEVIAITAPEAPLAAFFRFGAGYRFIEAQQGPGSSGVGPIAANNFDLTVLGIGAQIKAGDWLRIVPEAALEVGPLNLYSSLQVTAYFDSGGRAQD